MSYTIKIDETNDKSIYEIIGNGLRVYNAPYFGLDTYKDFIVYMKDESGRVMGGLCASIRQYPHSKIAWVNDVWVDESYRGKGLGTKLFAKLDDYAFVQNCTVIQLTTYDFQGKPFYEKQGYECISEIHNALAGRTNFYMRKMVVPVSSLTDFSDVILEESENKEVKDVINRGLSEYNKPYFGEENLKYFTIYAADNSGKIIGGMRGCVDSLWIWLNLFWVDEDFRHQGIGKILWNKLEEYAKANNCSLILLYTADFQAKPFYEKMGCKIAGITAKWIDGRDSHYMRKELRE